MAAVIAGNVVVTTARATAVGATRMTAVMVATMTSNGNEDNEDSNSKNKDKATTKPTMTTEEGERHQSRRDIPGGRHSRPCNAAIAPAAALS